MRTVTKWPPTYVKPPRAWRKPSPNPLAPSRMRLSAAIPIILCCGRSQAAPRGYRCAQRHSTRARSIRTQTQLQIRRRNRFAEQEPLHLIATFIALECELPLGFDALGQNPQSETATHGDHRAGNGSIARIVRQAADESLIDFERVERQMLQSAQRRVAGTEVVDGNAHAALT